ETPRLTIRETEGRNLAPETFFQLCARYCQFRPTSLIGERRENGMADSMGSDLYQAGVSHLTQFIPRAWRIFGRSALRNTDAHSQSHGFNVRVSNFGSELIQ